MNNVLAFTPKASDGGVVAVQPVYFYAANRKGVMEFLASFAHAQINMVTIIGADMKSMSADWDGDKVTSADLEQLIQAASDSGLKPVYFGCYFLHAGFAVLTP